MVALEEQFSLCRQLCQDLAQDLQKEALRGKTVTLKLKNVNFEVKTRAWTLPCAVATSDELFAVAKDLLKTEIDNVSPQPLRLRLMGIRVSSFVRADDKKPQQKSIVGFLQQGRADSSSPSQISSHKPVKEHPPKPPGHTQPFPCPSLQSFFQKARAQRLRLQAEREDPPEDGKWNNPNTSAETHFSMSALTAPDNMTHAPTASSTEAHVSTSLYWSTEPGTDSLTCPVCFREVNTTDLTVFNRHVDQCLSGVPMEHNIHTDTELERGSSVCEEEVEKEREGEIEKEIAEGERRREEGLMEKGRDPLSGPRPMTTPKVESHDPREPALTCPVCQVTQDTDNLTLFNRHVDLCLNQEVLHELEGLASVDCTTHNATPAAHKEREQPLRRAPQKGKSKRRGSSPPPPSKKVKALGPARNTIDKFFR
ncbi:unnamed protein product [Oncorhynchus mykiss]|uniref:DNA-directed DNA polymerase n=1 Tax=Oncorhynchus mykiss TaxID=8022 RepID=A0A060X248_ONCMY|nr:unnamed protein product [Oncorhynchus mykiss]